MSAQIHWARPEMRYMYLLKILPVKVYDPPMKLPTAYILKWLTSYVFVPVKQKEYD